jgi:ABC-type bacteriocin/lantibiotic exporter with double-glycine peptidase domain
MPKRLLKVPPHKQQQETDCLAACAAMMLDYLGITPTYPQLLAILDVAPWGTPHRNLRRIPEKFPAVHVKHQQGALPELFQAIDRGYPPAVFVWTGELPYWSIQTWHAIVIIGYDETSFFVNDPAFTDAPQIVSHGDLDLAWIAYDTYFALIQPA